MSYISWLNPANIQKVARFSQTGFAKDFLGGFLSKPVFITDVQEHCLQEAKKPPSKNESLFTKGFRLFKNNFAVGDLLSIFGIGSFIGIKKFLSSDSTLTHLLEVLNFGVIFGGFGLARIGQMFNFHKEHAFGDEWIDFRIQEGEKRTNKPVLAEMDIKTLIKEFEQREKELVYDPGISSELKSRMKREGKIGGFFCGPAGGGKSEGVRMLLGGWAKNVIEKDNTKTVSIHELNLQHFEEALNALRREESKRSEVLSLVDGLGDLGQKNESLVAFEFLIRRCQGIVKESKDKPNHASAIFIDEFDKIFSLEKLKGCDTEKLIRLLDQLHKLLADNYGSILITSNYKVDEVRQILIEVLGKDKESLVIQPFIERLKAVPIDLPTKQAQAEIIAKKIIQDFKSEELDFTSGGNKIENLNKDSLLTAILLDNYIVDKSISARELAEDLKTLKCWAEEKRLPKLNNQSLKEFILMRKEELSMSNVEKAAQKEKEKGLQLVQEHISNNKAKFENLSQQESADPVSLLNKIYDVKKEGAVLESATHSILFTGDNTVRIMFHDAKSKTEVAITNHIDKRDFLQIISIELAKATKKKVDWMGFFSDLSGCKNEGDFVNLLSGVINLATAAK